MYLAATAAGLRHPRRRAQRGVGRLRLIGPTGSVMLRQLNDDRAFDDVPFLLVATPTLVNTSRTVDDLHTVKMLNAVAYDPGSGRTWDDHKMVVAQRYLEAVRRYCPDFTDDVIVAMDVRSPVDLNATTPR